MSSQELLEVVNEQDEVIGLATREEIHREGLLHREVHVWFFNPKGELILQHRAKNKDTFPDVLDATVGGHVEPGMSYDETARKECEEETGVIVEPNCLHTIAKVFKRFADPATGTVNNTVRTQYAYLYKGRVEDLRIEEGKGEGFEVWPLERLEAFSAEERKRVIPVFYDADVQEIVRQGRAWCLAASIRLSVSTSS